MSTDLLSLRIEKANLLKKRLALLASLGGMAAYSPHEKQDAFHRAGVKFKRRMGRTGNRFGKSTMGCAEDCAWVRGERLWYPPDDPARRGGIKPPPNKGLIITEDWDLVDSIFTSQRGEPGKIWKMLPKDGFVKSTRRNHSGVIESIECANGSMLRFDTVKSWKANPGGGESSDWDFIHVDEPCPRGMWVGASRGLVDRGGSAWFTFTPLKEFWINDIFFPQETGGAPRDDVWAISGSIYDNPHLDKDAIKEFESSLTEDEKQCRINGIPLHLSGLVYKEFNWDKHVLKDLPKGWSSYNQPPDDWPVYLAIDPHPRTPHAVLFCTVDHTGRRYYFKDIFRHCIISELCPIIHTSLRNSKGIARDPIWVKLDPFAYIPDPITESDVALEFERHGIFPEKATKDLDGGIMKVKAGLLDGSIVFTPACVRTLWEIQRYAWQDDKEKPVDEDDHMMENLYRMELGEPTWVDVNSKSNFPIPDLVINRSELKLEPLSYLLRN